MKMKTPPEKQDKKKGNILVTCAYCGKPHKAKRAKNHQKICRGRD